MPITIGGKISKLKHIEQRLELGADKVAINTAAYIEKGFINEAAKEFGSQCIVVSIDYRLTENNKSNVYINCGRDSIDMSPLEWASRVEDMGAGEIIINSIDNDGSGNGYDLENLRLISNKIKCPIIACGGAGNWEHFKEIIQDTGCDAAAAANIFHYQDQSVFLAKKYLYDNNSNVRKPDLIEI